MKWLSTWKSNQVQEMNIYDILGEPLSEDDFKTGVTILDDNFEQATDEKLCVVLFNLLREKGWTKERFRKAVLNVLETKNYKRWKIGDLMFQEMPKMYNRSWYLKKLDESKSINQLLVCYSYLGNEVYFYKTDLIGISLPSTFKKLW